MGRGKGGSPRPKKDKTERERERERETGFLPKLFRVQFFPFLYLHTSSEREKKERKTFLFRDERREIEKKIGMKSGVKNRPFCFFAHTREREKK